jgi:hypothetical protein
MKPTVEKYQAATKVNALSSEIDKRRKDRQFARVGRQHSVVRKNFLLFIYQKLWEVQKHFLERGSGRLKQNLAVNLGNS